MWVLFVLKPSLLSDQIIYSRLVMYILCLSSRISHFSKGTCCFYWRMAWETKIWAPDAFTVTWVLLLLIPISCLNKSMYVFTNVYGLCRGTMVKNPASAGGGRAVGLIPVSGRSPGEGNSNLLQYSSLENFMDTGAWKAAKSWSWLSTHTH